MVVARHANYDTVRSDNFNLNEGLNIRYIQVDFEPPRGDGIPNIWNNEFIASTHNNFINIVAYQAVYLYQGRNFYF